MKIYNSIDDFSGDSSRVALGFFDGVHTGHRAVIAACRESDGGDMVVLTFQQSPAAVLGRPVPPALTDNSTKAQLMEKLGSDAVIFADFRSIMELSAEDFVKKILRDKLRASAVCCGYNYRFGKNGEGDTDRLIGLCAGEGITVKTVEPVIIGGEPVSSTRIRELLSSGNIVEADSMLGYPYAVRGDIGGGNRIGRSLGFPTVNIPIADGLCVPAYGVYASRITVGGVTCLGATNIGVHPTVGEIPRPLCETFIIGYSGGELYGSQAVCELTDFIRPEKKFSSVEELCRQVEKDIEEIKNK